MINVTDNFLSQDVYDYVYGTLLENEFNGVSVRDGHFWVQNSWVDFDRIVLDKINKIERSNRRNILSFFRLATNELDTDWRIHSDAIIDGERPERALVLYLSPSTMEGLHGTAFWKHKELGDCLPSNISSEDYDNILANEANNIDKWDLGSVIGYKVNRVVSYPCNYFHSKYPNLGWSEGRMVYVMFYK
jgi:hypothetical protein